MHKILIVMLIALVNLSVAGAGFAYEKEIKALSATMSEKVAKAGKKNIAVADFTDLQGNTTELGRFLAEELSADLAEDGKGFEIVDRNNLRSILNEHKFSMSGLVDPKTIKQLGQIAGVDAIVTGTVTPFGDSVRVSAKVIATDTAKVIAAAKGDIAKTKAIEELLSRGIDTRTEASPATVSSVPTPRPAKGGQSIEMSNFVFNLKWCKTSGQTIICDLLVTNKDNDRQIYVDARETRLFDDYGNEYRGSLVQLGKDTGVNANSILVKEIPVKSSYRFEGISSQLSFITMLELYTDKGRVQFRNVPLSK